MSRGRKMLPRFLQTIAVIALLCCAGLGDNPAVAEETPERNMDMSSNMTEYVRGTQYTDSSDSLGLSVCSSADEEEHDIITSGAETAAEQETVRYCDGYDDCCAPEMYCIGTYTVTAYCGCEICCGEYSNMDNPTTASGEPAVEGVTVGAEMSVLPAGTIIYIEGVGERIVQDEPADWIIERYDGRIIDLYFENHEDAAAFGKRELEIYIIGGAQ